MNKSNNDDPKNNPVHTPTPPQVMDPSQPPKEEGGKDKNEKTKKGRKKSSGKEMSSDKNKTGAYSK